ncbi:MAG TPA: hypothetical protein VHE35_02255, partial [Kofleriaceae bacterium]|nr:hypothetical protein [Kofleriaceae bacterium]
MTGGDDGAANGGAGDGGGDRPDDDARFAPPAEPEAVLDVDRAPRVPGLRPAALERLPAAARPPRA